MQNSIILAGGMENEHVLFGLIRKRAEVAGELEAAQQRVRQLTIWSAPQFDRTHGATVRA
ncbi:hypothetical protein GCM10009416_08620 [Craurococcus roseus]|uniref:Uncharacterized protein n=1 Tax=Craurococcus roseus TaxID=77585 RepID=A0ABN1ER40_9PROT